MFYRVFVACIAVLINSAHAEQYALLVGVSQYEHPKIHPLHGVANDTRDLAKILVVRGLPETQIKVLVSGGSTEPIRKNIIHALQELTDTAKQGDVVMIYLAGHGSRQPVDSNDKHQETDALDEIFLPQDTVLPQQSKRHSDASNAIRDNEIGAYIHAMRRQGTFVWLIVDSCHSATMARGETPRPASIITRSVPDSWFGVTPDIPPPDSQGFFSNLATKEDVPGGFVGFYAAMTHQKAYEFAQNASQTAQTSHGFFSQALLEALAKEQDSSYRELSHTVLQWFNRADFLLPYSAKQTPVFEGDLDTEVLSLKSVAQRWQWLLRRKNGKWFINAGLLHGFKQGAIFDIVTDMEAQPIGTASTSQVQTLHSLLDLQQDIPVKILKGSYARLHQPNLEFSLRVGLPHTLNTQEQAVIDGLQNTGTPGLTLAWQESGEPADIYLVFSAELNQACPSNHIWLLHPGETVDCLNSQAHFAIPLNGSSQPNSILQALLRIAKVKNLLKLLPYIQAPDEQIIDLSVQYCPASHVNKEKDCDTDWIEISDTTMPELHPDDRIRFGVHNQSYEAMDVTLLYIDAHYRVSSIFPNGTTNRLEPFNPKIGQGGKFEQRSGSIQAQPLGIEYLLLLASKAEPGMPVTDFRFLTQDSLNGNQRSGQRSFSRLQSLFAHAGFGFGTRGEPQSLSANILLRRWLVIEKDSSTAFVVGNIKYHN
ncbi:caspase family protein [Candidatus Venteria ishoeyi]|nr:caspase family protein [Candidatus Venteria ishoeyi]